MGAHERPEATLATIENWETIRLRAELLLTAFDAHQDNPHPDNPGYMDAGAWRVWEGCVANLLQEIIRG